MVHSSMVVRGCRISVVVSAVLTMISGSSLGGTITFGGDLAGNLPAMNTPALIGASGNVSQMFNSNAVAGVGSASGTVTFVNNATATAGSIILTSFVFQSLKAANTAPVSFSITITQNFTYGGLAQINATDTLMGNYLFTAGNQFGRATEMASVQGTALPNLRANRGSGNPPYPKSPAFNGSGGVKGIAAGAMITEVMTLNITLSDNSVGMGPRLVLPNSATVNFLSVPEPSSIALLGIGGISLLGLAWGRRRDRS